MLFDVSWLNLTTISSRIADLGVNFTQISNTGRQFFDLVEKWCLELPTVNLASLTSVEFSEFQTDLVKTLLGFVAINTLLILFYWHRYGEVITDKFIRPSTAKEIEELKQSVARLKLPKDYTPRI